MILIIYVKIIKKKNNHSENSSTITTNNQSYTLTQKSKLPNSFIANLPKEHLNLIDRYPLDADEIMRLPIMSKQQFYEKIKTDRSKLVIILNIVHNVRDFIDKHPGGPYILNGVIGDDVTEQVLGHSLKASGDQHLHTIHALYLMADMAIARLPANSSIINNGTSTTNKSASTPKVYKSHVLVSNTKPGPKAIEMKPIIEASLPNVPHEKDEDEEEEEHQQQQVDNDNDDDEISDHEEVIINNNNPNNVIDILPAIDNDQDDFQPNNLDEYY